MQCEVLKEPLWLFTAEKTDLTFYRIINDNWNNKLNKNGKLFLEIGDEQEKIFCRYFQILIILMFLKTYMAMTEWLLPIKNNKNNNENKDDSML